MSPESPTEKSKIPTVMGILSLVFGALGACYNLGSAAFVWAFSGIADNVFGSGVLKTATQNNVDAQRLVEALRACMAELLPWATRMSLLLGVSSVGLVMVGWGLLGRRAWARSATMAWVGLAALVIVVRMAVAIYLGHRMEEILGPLASAQGVPDQIHDQMSFASSLTSLLLMAAYPTVLAILVLRLPAAELGRSA